MFLQLFFADVGFVILWKFLLFLAALYHNDGAWSS